MNSDQGELARGDATIMHKILQSSLPPEDKALQRLVEEGQVLIAAGQTTTADTLERATYELLSNPDKLRKLSTELKAAIPDPHELPSWRELEQLPYLRAVITEALRLATPVPSRLQRIAPDEDLKVQGSTVIPAGTPIGMSAYLMHFRNPNFPEAHKFQPERWLVPEQERHKLEKYLVPFSKGSRICLGMHLAEAELFIALAAIFRRFELELFKTTLKDIQLSRDYFTAFPYEGSERARVLVKPDI